MSICPKNKSSKDKTNFVNFINNVIDQNLITQYDDFYSNSNNNNFYTMNVYYTIHSTTDVEGFVNREYIIEEKNIEKVLDLVAKYNLYKFNN